MGLTDPFEAKRSSPNPNLRTVQNSELPQRTLRQSTTGETIMRPLQIMACLSCATLLAACDITSPNSVSPHERPDRGLPDYTIVVDSSVSALTDLDTTAFEVHVQNVGGIDTLGTLLYMYVDDVIVMDTIVEGLETLAAETFSFVWPARPGAHAIRFAVDEPPSGGGWVREANEKNNSVTFELTVRIAERIGVGLDTLFYSQLPLAITGAPAVVKMLKIAADSGFTIPSGAETIQTRYEPGGVVSYVTPFGNPGSTSETPILVAMAIPVVGADTSIYAYLYHYSDDASAVVHTPVGSVRLFLQDDSVQVLDSPATAPYVTAQAGCSEAWWAACAQNLGVSTLSCVASVLGIPFGGGTPVTLIAFVAALATCGATAFAAQGCVDALTDNPPTIQVVGVQNGVNPCYKCEGGNRIKYTFDGYEATATDDRGPTPPFFNSSNKFAPTCNGGSYTFSVTDCGGNTVTRTVSARGRRLGTEEDHPACNHEQGAGRNLLTASSLRSRRLTFRSCPTRPHEAAPAVSIAAVG